MKDLVIKFLAENGYVLDVNIIAIHCFFEDDAIMKANVMYESMFLAKKDSVYSVHRVVIDNEVVRFENEDDLLGGSYEYQYCDNDHEALDNFMYDVDSLLN